MNNISSKDDDARKLLIGQKQTHEREVRYSAQHIVLFRLLQIAKIHRGSHPKRHTGNELFRYDCTAASASAAIDAIDSVLQVLVEN